MRNVLATVLLSLALAACGHSGGGSSGKYTPPPSPIGWTSYSGTVVGTCDSFSFGEPHYCIKAMSAQQGQTIRMTFTTSGTGTLQPAVGSGDNLPVKIGLLLWRRGDNMSCAGPYQQYRYWYRDRINIVVGTTQTLIGTLDPGSWTDCYGKPGSDNPAAFAAALSDLYAVGYTFGGANFAGHGVAAVGGPVHFTLNEFSIGNQLSKRRVPLPPRRER
jgi:hypothetical protein